jgi:hypothetical protein
VKFKRLQTANYSSIETAGIEGADSHYVINSLVYL